MNRGPQKKQKKRIPVKGRLLFWQYSCTIKSLTFLFRFWGPFSITLSLSFSHTQHAQHTLTLSLLKVKWPVYGLCTHSGVSEISTPTHTHTHSPPHTQLSANEIVNVTLCNKYVQSVENILLSRLNISGE